MKYIIAFIILFFASRYSYCHQLKGRIFDTQKHPIEGAYVYHPLSGKHAHSNTEGYFTLPNINIGDTIFLSHMAYENQSIIISNDDKEISITLHEKMLSLNEVKITSHINSLSIFTDIDIKTNPVNSSQEILRKVPGLIIGQHAGGGKAEQMFLRGFDIDHGTDVNITVDELPVNMVSHAHGQGYADLHFLIPETIDKIDFGKGTYYADKGNFTTAGYVGFKTKDVLKNSEVKLNIGQFNTLRLMGMFNVLNNEEQSAYLASEYLLGDGAFESPQNLSRINLMGKYTQYLPNNNEVSFILNYFQSKWNASGQVPQRAIDSGLITRFGAIDDTEGGYTGRKNFIFKHLKHIDDNTWIKSNVYYSEYNFELYSNFTLYLNDSINGDQIRQKEDRIIYGAKSEWNHQFKVRAIDGLLKAAVGFRADEVVNNELSRTLERKITLSSISLGNVYESNYFAFINAEFRKGKWLVNPSLRYDWFKFNYINQLIDQYKSQLLTKAIISPKLNILFNPSNELQWYLKTGKGFHSNDTRVIVEQKSNEIIPAAYGSDLGCLWKASSKLIVNAALWQLFMQQEFIYVGDEGIVEPGGRSQRAGIDFGIRYQIGNYLFLNNDINYTYARSIDDLAGENYIPLAPDYTMMGGLSYIPSSGLYGNLTYRLIKNRPANENNSIVAKGYTIVDANVGYQWKELTLSLSAENLLNNAWNETQFATESRLKGEIQSVEEIHFIPGTPFFLKGSISYKF